MFKEDSHKYDVVIAGGGLAGLTLALQLKQSKPDIDILVVEKREDPAPAATYKVGESLSELGSFYLREILGLKGYLTNHQLPKFGFRFFLSPEHADDITKRVEVGSKIFNPFPSHQVDRGRLENDLVQQLGECGVDIILGARVTDAELSKSGHLVRYVKENTEYHAETKWLVDSTGRKSFLKRKLNLEGEVNHTINAAWFRLDAEIDMDYWSEDLAWRNFVDPGRRRLATNHLMGEGYWVWIIPLISGRTSIGIVADPGYHPFSGFNSFEKAMRWLEIHEPLAAAMLHKHKGKLMDFKVMKNCAYNTKQFYSLDKWALTGEASAFLDPLYSPGSDFIGLGNTWITDLITRDLAGEDTAVRTLVFDFAHKELLRGWAGLYQDMYGLFGKTQIMLMKIVWDWASYWSIPNVLFANRGYIDLDLLKQFSSSSHSIGRRFAALNENMQHLFRSWGQYPGESISGYQLNVFDLSFLHQLHTEIGRQYKPGELIEKIGYNLRLLEQIAAEIFRKVSSRIHHTPVDMKVDPYHMKLDQGADELLKKADQENTIPLSEQIRTDINRMWLTTAKTPENEFIR